MVGRDGEEYAKIFEGFKIFSRQGTVFAHVAFRQKVSWEESAVEGHRPPWGPQAAPPAARNPEVNVTQKGGRERRELTGMSTVPTANRPLLLFLGGTKGPRCPRGAGTQDSTLSTLRKSWQG